MPPKAGGKKDAKATSKNPAKAAKAKSGGKAKKKKWSKGKVRDKLNNAVLFDQPTYDKLLKEVSYFPSAADWSIVFAIRSQKSNTESESKSIVSVHWSISSASLTSYRSCSDQA